MNNEKYRVIAASKYHAVGGRENGIAQACHSGETLLKRIRENDWVIIYSSKDSCPIGNEYQEFTFTNSAKDETVYPLSMADNFKLFCWNIIMILKMILYYL